MKKEPRLLGRQVWCLDCINLRPPIIRRAEYLIPARQRPYDLCRAGIGIDLRVYGVCSECLEKKERFQRDNAQPMDINHKHLVYRYA